MNSAFTTLIKREFWENRSLWLAPAIAGGLLLLLWIWGSVMAATHMGDFGGVNFGGGRTPSGPSIPRLGLALWGLASQLYLVSSLACGFYLLDCLYAERKDRSILFWKSLPVSDAHTVLSKFVVATVIVPLGVYVLASVLYLVCYAIAAAAAPEFSRVTGGWDFVEWLRLEARMLGVILVTILWWAPLAAWNMLASVLSRRSPIILATMPVVVVAVCENIVLNTPYVWKFVAYRAMPVMDPLRGLLRPGLWIGLAVAAGMLYMVIRLRRYRDDT